MVRKGTGKADHFPYAARATRVRPCNGAGRLAFRAFAFHDPMILLSRRLAALACLTALSGCSDSGPDKTIEGVSPEENGTLQPDATTSPSTDITPEQQFDPSATLEPDVTLQPDTTAAPGATP